MFFGCRVLTSLDLSSFDSSKVTDMSGMFKSCRELTYLDLSSFNTSEVTGMEELFCFCSKLRTLDISTFNLSKVKKNEMWRMFYGCDSLKTVIMKNCSAATVKKIKSVLPESVEIIR